MSADQLKELGLVRSGFDNEIHIPSQGENGRIIFDPLPELPPDPSLPPDGDPMIGVVMDTVNAEIAARARPDSL